MNARDPQSFRKRIATIAGILLAVHVLLCIYFAITPRKSILHGSVLGSLYHRVFLIGPFFTEDRIISSTQVYMRYKVKDGAWSQLFSYTNRVHGDSSSVLHQYSNLKHDDLLRYFAKAYRPQKTTRDKSNAQLCILSRYSINELLPQQAIDSINLLYIHHTFLRNNTVGNADTVWNATFNPDRCVP